MSDETDSLNDRGADHEAEHLISRYGDSSWMYPDPPPMYTKEEAEERRKLCPICFKRPCTCFDWWGDDE